MLISRLSNLNIYLKHCKKTHFMLINKLHKNFPNFYTTSSYRNFERIQNFRNEKNNSLNLVNILHTENKKLQKMERIISNLDDYTFKNFDDDFALLLMEFYKHFLFISKTQVSKISNLSSTITRINSKIFEYFLAKDSFQSINQAKGLLYFIYVLEKKNIYNMTRDENNNIIPKILKYFEENQSKISMGDLLELTQISVHFGSTIDVKLIESRLNGEINLVTFDVFNHIVRNLRDHKNNKLNYYKTILINMFKEYYIELGKKEQIKNKLSLLSNLSNISVDLPGLDLYQDLFKFMLDIQREFLLNEKIYEQLDQNSVNHLFESIINLQIIQKENSKDSQIDMLIKSKDFVNMVNNMYDYISNKMIFLEIDKVIPDSDKSMKRNFNFPLFLLFIKNISLIETHLLPKEEHLILFFKFVKINLSIDKYVHREAIFCFKLMKRTSYIDDQLAENLGKYLIDQLHLMNVKKYPLTVFKETLQNLYRKDLTKFEENILKPLTGNIISLINFSRSKLKPIFLLRLLITCNCFSDINASDETCEKVFNKLICSLSLNPNEFLIKEYYKILEYLVINPMNLNSKHAEVLNFKLISFLFENRDHYVILDLTSTKIMVYLENLNVKEDSNSTFQMREMLINFILEFRTKKFGDINFLKIFHEFRMLAENNINIHPKTINRISYLIIQKKYGLKVNQLENFMKFIYIFLKNYQNVSNSDLRKLHINAIVNLLSSIDFQTIDYQTQEIKFSATLEIISKILNLLISSKEIQKILHKIYDDLKLIQIRKNKF